MKVIVRNTRHGLGAVTAGNGINAYRVRVCIVWTLFYPPPLLLLQPRFPENAHAFWRSRLLHVDLSAKITLATAGSYCQQAYLVCCQSASEVSPSVAWLACRLATFRSTEEEISPRTRAPGTQRSCTGDPSLLREISAGYWSQAGNDGKKVCREGVRRGILTSLWRSVR